MSSNKDLTWKPGNTERMVRMFQEIPELENGYGYGSRLVASILWFDATGNQCREGDYILMDIHQADAVLLQATILDPAIQTVWNRYIESPSQQAEDAFKSLAAKPFMIRFYNDPIIPGYIRSKMVRIAVMTDRDKNDPAVADCTAVSLHEDGTLVSLTPVYRRVLA